MPFTLSPRLVFRRADVLADAGLVDGPITSLEDYLARLAGVGDLARSSEWEPHLPLRLAQALYEDAEGRTCFDQDRFGVMLEGRASSPLDPQRLTVVGARLDAFRSGRSLALLHHTFFAMMYPELPWQPAGTPQRPCHAIPMGFALVAGSAQRELALEAMRWLGSDSEQARYLGMGAGLPTSVGAAALLGEAEMQRRGLGCTVVPHPTACHHRGMPSPVTVAIRDCLSGRIDGATAADRCREAVFAEIAD